MGPGHKARDDICGWGEAERDVDGWFDAACRSVLRSERRGGGAFGAAGGAELGGVEGRGLARFAGGAVGEDGARGQAGAGRVGGAVGRQRRGGGIGIGHETQRRCLQRSRARMIRKDADGQHLAEFAVALADAVIGDGVPVERVGMGRGGEAAALTGLHDGAEDRGGKDRLLVEPAAAERNGFVQFRRGSGAGGEALFQIVEALQVGDADLAEGGDAARLDHAVGRFLVEGQGGGRRRRGKQQRGKRGGGEKSEHDAGPRVMRGCAWRGVWRGNANESLFPGEEGRKEDFCTPTGIASGDPEDRLRRGEEEKGFTRRREEEERSKDSRRGAEAAVGVCA